MLKFHLLSHLTIVSFGSTLLSFGLIFPVNADTTKVRCDFYPKGEDRATASTACTFSQRQGYIGIQTPSGTRYDFKPDSDRPNYYTDQNGDQVIREINENIGFVFRTVEESIFIYWDDNKSQNISQNNNSVRPTTHTTVQDLNNIAIHITEGEFSYQGILKRTSGREFMGSDGKVRVLLNPYDGHVVVFNEATGTEFYNYYITPVSGVGEDPNTMCDPSREPC